LQIFLNEENLKPDESRTPIFTDKQNSIKDISKKLTEIRRRYYALKRDENMYRGVVLKTLVNQPISNFMYANCKTPFKNSLFRFTVKAHSQCLVTHFMRHLIFRGGNGICNLCNRDRMDTLCHILNGCPKLTTHYTNRHNKIVQVVVEAISTNCNLFTETIHENKCVVIDEKFSKSGKFKTKIRPDIWYWTVSNKGKIAPTTFLTLHMVEIKACWGAECKENHNHEEINTMKKVYFTAANKYQKAQAELEHHLKPSLDGFQNRVESDILVVSSLGAFTQNATTTLENILETKSNKTIRIWGRRIVTAAIKGSFDIWLKKTAGLPCSQT
jgi:hypothetical protein